MAKAQIYYAVQFHGLVNGFRKCDKFVIAACSNAEAIETLKDVGYGSENLFLSDNDGHGRGGNWDMIDNDKFQEHVTEAEFQQWVNRNKSHEVCGITLRQNYISVDF